MRAFRSKMYYVCRVNTKTHEIQSEFPVCRFNKLPLGTGCSEPVQQR